MTFSKGRQSRLQTHTYIRMFVYTLTNLYKQQLLQQVAGQLKILKKKQASSFAVLHKICRVTVISSHDLEQQHTDTHKARECVCAGHTKMLLCNIIKKGELRIKMFLQLYAKLNQNHLSPIRPDLSRAGQLG